MKLIIQIPCKNEEENLLKVLAELPREIEGIDVIEYQVIDDGSSDDTYNLAKKVGVHHVIRFKKNKGLGFAFKAGVENALKNGADILVNTDADNQYPSKYIKDLVKPIIEGRADIVIGNREPTKISYFGWRKRKLQWFGNLFLSFITGETLPDSVSGFRAYSRESLYELNVTSKFSYVIDTIIQAYKKGLKVEWISIATNPPTRPSRLFKNTFEHIKKSAVDILRVYTMYEPLKVFLIMSIPFLFFGSLGILGFFYHYFLADSGAKMVELLIVSGGLVIIGISLFSLGIIADLIAKNRFLIEENMKMIKKMKYDKKGN